MHKYNQLLHAMAPERVELLLDLLAHAPIEITAPPSTGLIMMTVRDSFDTAFHPGEVLVTEARISIEGAPGYAMVVGEDPRRAVLSAIVDALARCPQPPTCVSHLNDFFDKEEQLQEQARGQENGLIAATTVTFDLLPGA